jgi:uncharacterized protein (TIGR00251 family)
MARRISLTVKPQAKQETVTALTDNHYLVTVRAPAKDGKANARVVELLARHFQTSKSRIRILRGLTSRLKLIEFD